MIRTLFTHGQTLTYNFALQVEKLVLRPLDLEASAAAFRGLDSSLSFGSIR